MKDTFRSQRKIALKGRSALMWSWSKIRTRRRGRKGGEAKLHWLREVIRKGALLKPDCLEGSMKHHRNVRAGRTKPGEG